ncbi:MAG: pyridoxamine 5'-phosphate oxidase family protein [Desulfobulbales bacterium]|nr:pyridoxamine 5'-phosphate oxidase family protein [Desulfobulbales bacterium]
MAAVKEQIASYLKVHLYLRLATVTAAAKPLVHTVGYISEGCTVCFATDSKSRKAENISKNPAVAYAVDENYEDMMAIQGVQMEGKAAQVSVESETIRLLDLMVRKFAGLEKMPPNPDLVFFKIKPIRGFFLDNTVAFGHRDMVEF